MIVIAASAAPSDTPEKVSLGLRMRDGYLAAALFTLVELGEVTREVNLLDSRGAVRAHGQAVKRQVELRERVERYKAIAQLLHDGGLT